ncbi:MAG: septum formation protein Maf [Acidobacteria bacterium]|nr:septum formation protein Maf [Acidobacteriota bacterium]
MNLPKLILASGSPRRSEILAAVGWEFEKVVPDVDETVMSGESPEDYVVRVAKMKAFEVGKKYPAGLILAADTVVVVDKTILGKPADPDDARSMISKLSGRTHEVLTGVVLSKNGLSENGMQRTLVTFSKLSDAEISFLVETGNPLDKAGAYAVQAQAALFIEGIDGDYWNVVGLPISLVYRLAVRFF